MNTKFFRLFASLLLVFAAPTAYAYDFAVENSDGVTIYYKNTSTTKLTLEVTFKDTNYNSYAGDVVVPTVVTYNDQSYRVTSVGEFAFYNCVSLKSVTLPNNVTKIGKCAFSYCYELTSMEIPTRVNSIAEDAFVDCRSLTSMTIPNSVDIIEGNVFKGCAGLKEINVGDSNKSFASVDGVLFNKDMSQLIAFPGGHESKDYTIPYGVLTIGEYAFSRCDVTSVEIPNTVVEIGESAFSNCNSLTSMIFPDYVKRIGNDAFHDCQYMKSVILPNNITGIEDGTFYNCYKLEKVIMPATVEYIGEYAFANCYSLKKMICLSMTPPDITESTFEEASIAECSLNVLSERVNVYKSAEGWKDFHDVSYNSFDFYGNSNNNIIYYNYVSRLVDNKSCEVTCTGIFSADYKGDVEIPSRVFYDGDSYEVTRIGLYAFSMCFGLTSVSLPRTIAMICSDAFLYSSGLTSITIPANVKRIDGNVFAGCSSLKEILVEGDNMSYASNQGVLFNKDETELIAFPGGHEGKNYTIPYGVNVIGEYAFSRCGVTSVELPNTIIEIGDAAFFSCNSLKSMIFPDYVKKIGKDAFHDCQYMKSVILPNNITGIEERTFYKCYCLEKVIMPGSVEYIGEYAFAECYHLKNMTCLSMTPPDITESTFKEASIGECFLHVPGEKIKVYKSADGWKDFYDVSVSSFDLYGNTNNNIIYFNYLTDGPAPTCEVTCTEMFAADYKGVVEILSCVIYGGIEYEVTSIGEYAFFFCSDLTEVLLPRTITNIGMLGLGYCPGLTSIDLPQSLATIRTGAFGHSTGLTSITIPANVTTIEGNVFEGCSSLKEILVEGANKSYASYQGVLFNKDETELIAFPAGHETKNYTIPNSVVKIGDLAFIYCNGLTYVTIPNSVRYFGKVPFKRCDSLREFNVAYDNPAFSSLDGVLFSKDQMQLYCFPISHKSTEYTVPNDVMTIEDFAFEGCVNLTALTFPESVIGLGSGALNDCKSLQNLVCLNPMPPTAVEPFQESLVTTCVLKVLKESVDDYKAADYWKDFLHIVGIETSGVATIATDADTDAPAYNLQGAKVTDNYKGIVIKNGKKFLNVR